MPLPADYHMHTPLCRHAKGEPTEYAARAIEAGVPEIGFSARMISMNGECEPVN